MHWQCNYYSFRKQLICVKIAQQDGVLQQGKVHLANQVKLQLPDDEVNDQTVAMTVIEAMPYYDQMLWSMQEMMPPMQ